MLVTAFAALNGLFVYLMRAPTALGRPIMDQLAGFRLYLETAEADRLNMQAPEITAERFEALLPYAVALDVEKPWADAFAAALRRAHPDDADPMRHYQPGWSSGGGWSGGNFGSAVASTVGGCRARWPAPCRSRPARRASAAAAAARAAAAAAAAAAAGSAPQVTGEPSPC